VNRFQVELQGILAAMPTAANNAKRSPEQETFACRRKRLRGVLPSWATRVTVVAA